MESRLKYLEQALSDKAKHREQPFRAASWREGESGYTEKVSTGWVKPISFVFLAFLRIMVNIYIYIYIYKCTYPPKVKL